MAHFYITARGMRGTVSRTGSKRSGAVATVNSWNDGVTIEASYDEKTDQNSYKVLVTGGSNGVRQTRVLVTIFADGTIKQ